ncbi:dienelactone hydrolase family protein [Agriterribacter sp.]|uniref:carboxylesterase family protein n=1 Tax=Agriterribacter sp. TaxID=2821509 RepID=UPI002BFBB8D3|nr:dienelactone hydrolase family protein [Agriterribacter sp.]HRO46645.1 dienelactone hydrolase family protein [Agriterribacter sp.]HRQ17305.1 dienelactone hydrolase family protein [Agriterribacter sp.]
MKPAIVKLLCILLLHSIFISCKKENTGLDAGSATKPDMDVIETLPPVQVAVSYDLTPNCAGFYRALPARYDSTAKNYPLLVFLHGSGEMGNGTTDLPKVLKNAVPNLINKKKFPPNFTSGGKNFSFIVLSPQVKSWTTPEDVRAMIQYAIAKLRVDTTRIYVTGLSLGGNTTWNFASKYGQMVTAIVPVCASNTATAANTKAIASKNIPVWTFHNEDDPAAPVQKTKDFVAMINSYNPNPKARLTLWPTGGHDAWTKATDPLYKENKMNIYEWMLQYHK